MKVLKLDVLDERVTELLLAWGIPYCWGAGTPVHGGGEWPPYPLPRGINGGRGFDCSGFAQAALVRLGLLDAKAPDRTAAALWDLAKPVDETEARLGDLAFYGPGGRISHVTVCLGFGATLGANGGGSTTNGDSARAFVQLQPIRFRADFRGIRRLV